METSENIMKVDDPNAGFLSAAELVQIRKSNEEPARSNIGEKFYIRQNNWMESKAVECALENYTDSLKQNRAARKCDLIQAKWNEELNVSIATKLKGKFLQHMGYAYDGKVALSPEESIFLLENGCIEILNGEMPLSTEEAYKIMLKGDLSAEKYQVYSHLSQLGFVVVTHRKGPSTKPADSTKNQSKRKRKSSTEEEMYQIPEKKRTSFLGALSNLPHTTLNLAREDSSVPETASEVIITTSYSVSQECITIPMTPSPNNMVPKSSETLPDEAVLSENNNIITDSTVVTVDNSNPSSLEVNDEVEEPVSVSVNNLGGHAAALLSANSNVERDDLRLSVEDSTTVQTSASNKPVNEKEISVRSEHSDSDPCCSASSTNFEVGLSKEDSEKINNDVYSNGILQMEDSESCCGINSNPALLNFKAAVSETEEVHEETNNAVEKDFSSKEISVQIEDSESCNGDNLNTAESNFRSKADVPDEGIKEAGDTANVFSPKELSVQVDDSESCDTNSKPAPSNFNVDINVSEEGTREINNGSENNPDFSSKEKPVQIEDSNSCNEVNSNPLNFEAAEQVSDSAKENNKVFSSEEKPVEIEDSDSCNEVNSNPLNFEASEQVSNSAQENNKVFSSEEKPVEIEDSDSCNEANSNPSNFEAAVRVSNNAIDIMNLDSCDTEVSCSSEVLETEVCNDWRMDARSHYSESNSDVMSCSSDEDNDDNDVLSIGASDEKLEDDEVELVAVTKKETKPLAVIDLLSDSENTPGSEFESDDEIQVVKVCEGVRSNDRQHLRSSGIHSTMKCKKEEKPSGNNSCGRLQIKFPQCAHQNMVVVTRPPSMYLPPNVVFAKESYTLTFSTCQAQARRVWNSYRELQAFQISQRSNQRTEEFQRNSRSNFHQSRFDSSGGYNSNSWSQNNSPNLEGNSFGTPWLNPVRNSPQGFPPFSGLHPQNDFNRGDTQSPDSRLSNNRMSNLNEPSIVSPFNTLPSFPNQFGFPPPNATAINSVVSVSNQDMNVRMVGNHIMHRPRPFMPGFNGSMDPRDLMAAVQRTAYSVATDVLSSMLGPNLPSHMLPRMPPYAGMPAQNGADSFGLLHPPNAPFGAPIQDLQMSNRRRQRLRRNYSSNPFPCQYRNVNNRQSWNEVREAVGEQDMELDVGSDVEEVPLKPTDVLWDPAGIRPLVKPGIKLPPAEILKKLQITQMANLQSNTHSNQVCLPTTCSLEISFDVYLPGTNYRKTSPGIPKHRIIVVRSTDPLPKYADVVFLQNKWNDGSTLQIAVVDNGDISFQSFNDVCLTVLVPHEK